MFVDFTALNCTIKHEDNAMICRFEDEDVLELGFLRVEDFLDL